MMALLRAWSRRRLDRDHLVQADARSLIERFGERAYDVARGRVVEGRRGTVLDLDRPPGHWTRVKLRIAEMSGREVGLDTATRMSTRAPHSK